MFGFSYPINLRPWNGKAPRLDSPTGSPAGPRRVKHSPALAGTKRRLAFIAHFIPPCSCHHCESCRYKLIEPGAAHPAGAETTALTFQMEPRSEALGWMERNSSQTETRLGFFSFRGSRSRKKILLPYKMIKDSVLKENSKKTVKCLLH